MGSRFRSRAAPLVLAAIIVMTGWGCGSKSPAEPSSLPVSGTAMAITGSERIGWSQAASGLAAANEFRYLAYVDGIRTLLPDAACRGGALDVVFECAARLPAMPAGAHRLELASAAVNGGQEIESAKSPALLLVRQ